MPTFGKSWFAPKHFGYGATPNTWQGWAAIAVMAALLIADINVFHGAWRWIIGAALIAAFAALAYVKTSAEWRWRNGAR